MKELKQTVIHHIEQAALKAGVRFDHDCRAELNAVFEAAEDRIQKLESRVRELSERAKLKGGRRHV